MIFEAHLANCVVTLMEQEAIALMAQDHQGKPAFGNERKDVIHLLLLYLERDELTASRHGT